MKINIFMYIINTQYKKVGETLMKNILLTFAIMFAFNIHADSDANKANVAKMYDIFQNGTHEEFINHYSKLMSEDFERWNGRYVGLGFTVKEEDMTVMSTNSSPAKDHFMPGDKFISVNGVNADSGEDLPFKGAVGGEVKVVLERDGKTVKVKMNRAVQTNTATKAQMLQGYETWTKEGWEDRGTMITVNPLVAEGNEVWGSFEMSWENDDGNQVRMWQVERFVFNDSGMLVQHGDLSEDLFVSEQNGYTLVKE